VKSDRTDLSEMIFWVSPHRITYCTSSSDYTDVNQHDYDVNHPHAFHDRGYFYEKLRKGKIIGGDWDLLNVKFNELLEYKSLYNHINNIERWTESIFAARIREYMLVKNSVWKKKCSLQERKKFIWEFIGSEGYETHDDFIAKRENKICTLIENIKLNGVLPAGGHGCTASVADDISVNLSSSGELLFNNRGHHRLAISKILNIKLIPVQIVVWHSDAYTNC